MKFVSAGKYRGISLHWRQEYQEWQRWTMWIASNRIHSISFSSVYRWCHAHDFVRFHPRQWGKKACLFRNGITDGYRLLWTVVESIEKTSNSGCSLESVDRWCSWLLQSDVILWTKCPLTGLLPLKCLLKKLLVKRGCASTCSVCEVLTSASTKNRLAALLRHHSEYLLTSSSALILAYHWANKENSF